ncbi:emp24/gp25L/p24 family/GOLD [Novymonas esmeraldas]|uniref:Emp24/gp25L/p24 family/GOLD n=1 Tax=Novymonas esmeraldas TaxID=1808958 RepID=A0AAW0EMR5_9TRYP
MLAHSSRVRRLTSVGLLLHAIAVVAVLLTCGCATGAAAFRFTLVPGKVKCFTSEQPEGGRYELRYRMTRSLTPLVSVAVTSRGGRVLMEHEVAKPDAKEIITVNRNSLISICFHTAEKATVAAVSLNVTLDIIDAEDAELTRMKKQSYSTSSPITLGAGKGSGAMQQMQYIYDTLVSTRASFVSLTRADEDIRYSLAEAERYSWMLVYAFLGLGILVTLGSVFRLRAFMKKVKLL